MELIALPDKFRVILVTDGDKCAQGAVESIAQDLGLRCISASGGNPTPISGEEIINHIKKITVDNPILVMFDDRGDQDKGEGETAMEYVANHPDIEVLGAVAVASNTAGSTGVEADLSVTDTGEIVNDGVDKNGHATHDHSGHAIISGDTVDVLNEVDIPVIVGVGDIGKMGKADDVRKGAPITKKAIEEILKRNDIDKS